MSKKQKTAITPTRDEDFPEWYQQVIKAADMAENSPVRGCMIIKPYGYALWENIQQIFDGMIKAEGVQNAYFPLLIPMEFMSREAEHVEGFAKECAVVTHHRLEAGPDGKLQPAESAKLEEPYIIRPTSETIIGDAMSRWIQSYRDLPMKLNQWANVMRWEMRTRMFLRTSEFLWQEGHNAFETAEDARKDALKMLDAYEDFVENYLAMPVIKGEKTEAEKFPGAVTTYTFEMMMQDGKALQGGTSHYLGENFARSIGIKFQGRDGVEHFAHTTSWGITTRLIGALIMIHGDDDGLVMPPRIAPQQAVILPFMKNNDQDAAVLEYADEIHARVKALGIRVFVDKREGRSADKMWDAVKKGIPLRIEVGGKELEQQSVTVTRRDLGRESKQTLSVDALIQTLPATLDSIHDTMFERSRAYEAAHVHEGGSVSDLRDFFSSGKSGFMKVPVSVLDDAALAEVMNELGLSTRVIPFEDEGRKVIISRAY